MTAPTPNGAQRAPVRGENQLRRTPSTSGKTALWRAPEAACGHRMDIMG
ncbi:hypothetical protein RR11_2821 [Ruegeria sp. R11]|nr:hypothetical protein RR11_2821 [Ruegeria sp. R11]